MLADFERFASKRAQPNVEHDGNALMNARRAVAAGLIPIVLPLAVGAAPDDELFAALLIAREHAVRVELDEPGGPRAIVMNRWIRTATLEVSTSESAADRPIDAALQQLDLELSRIEASFADIVRLSASTIGCAPGETADAAARITGYLRRKLPSKASHAPLDVLLGVFELVPSDRGIHASPSCTIMLNATVIDPRTAIESYRTDPGWDYRPSAMRPFVVGSAFPAGDARPPAPSASIAARLEELEALLEKVRAGPADLHELTVYYDQSAGLTEHDLRPFVDRLFSAGAPRSDDVTPRVRYIPARSAISPGASVLLEASGIVTHER